MAYKFFDNIEQIKENLSSEARSAIASIARAMRRVLPRWSEARLRFSPGSAASSKSSGFGASMYLWVLERRDLRAAQP